MMQITQTISVTMAAVEKTIKKSKKEYKAKEKQRRQSMTVDQRHHEDMGKLLIRLNM